MGNLEAKKEARAQAIASIKKNHGKNAADVYGDMEPIDVEVISTGSLALDDALGAGGYPRGRIIEIFGIEASGKTTLALHAIAEAQKLGGLCAFIDAEHALDINYASNLGVDVDDITLAQPDHGEQALDIVEQLVRSAAFDVIVVDSVAALVPKKEIDGEMGDSQVALQARLMSQACRKLSGIVSGTKTVLIFINQTRMKIGVMFGSPMTTSGGQALKFYASQRLEIQRTGTNKKGDESVGNRSRVKVIKNKVAAPFKQCEFDIVFGKGVNKTGEILDAAVGLKLVEKSGVWYHKTDGDRLGQGRDNAIETIDNDPTYKAELEREVRKHLGLLKDEEKQNVA